MQQKGLDLQNTILIVSIIILLLICFIGFVLILFYHRRKKSRLREKELEKQFAQTLLQSQLEIKEQTLQHIGRELHDNLGQIASLIKINLNTLPNDLADHSKALDKIETTKNFTRQLIGDLKSLSVSLGADRISHTGLAKALETEVERLNKLGQFKASLTQDGPLPMIDNDKAVILYRMGQEILNNMVKHSHAQHITILLNASENLFTLAFSDDGVGFDMAMAKHNDGAGLLNLHNRARLINAQLSMQSSPGMGTQVRIELPI